MATSLLAGGVTGGVTGVGGVTCVVVDFLLQACAVQILRAIVNARIKLLKLFFIRWGYITKALQNAAVINLTWLKLVTELH
jgi:predicted small integral membrane protein